MLRAHRQPAQDATLAFAIAVILLVAISLRARSCRRCWPRSTFGLVARHRRIAFSQAQRNFGALGDLLTVLLFVFAASTLDWEQVVAGGRPGPVAGAGARLVTKIAVCGGCSRACRGISWRKGVLTGLALTPMSVFAILLLEQTRVSGRHVARRPGARWPR